MKNLRMCVAALAMGTLLAVHVGCENVSNAVKGKMEQLKDEFDKGTALLQMQGKLASAKESRADLKKMADDFYVDSEVALGRIKRLEEEKGKTVETFNKLQDVAKNAALPKFTDATPEDLAKTIQVGTKTFTGEEIYRNLRDYKTQVEKADDAVSRERTQSDFYKGRADKIRSAMSRIDDNITKMERDIADYEMYKKLYDANKKMESLGLLDDKIDQLLNAGSDLAKFQDEIDRLAAQVKLGDEANRGGELDQELRRGPSFSITDDDLI